MRTSAFPEPLPSDLRSLPDLIDILTGANLEGVSLGRRRMVIEAAARMSRLRLVGWNNRREATVPEGFIGSIIALGAPFAFIAAGDGQELEISVGSSGANSVYAVARLRAQIGGPEPQPSRVAIPLLNDWPTWALTGIPAPMPPEEVGSSLDLIADALRGIPFIYLVLATPEPVRTVERDLVAVNKASQDIDRVLMQTGHQTGTQRLARQAIRLLEDHARRFEEGRRSGMWRVSVLLGTPSDHAGAHGMAAFAGRHRGGAGHFPIPLRIHPVSRAADDDGLSVHVNRLLSGELSRLCPLPARDRLGFRVVQDAVFDVDHPEAAGESIRLGSILDGQHVTDRAFTLNPNRLVRHAVVVGTTGFGKTTTIKNLLRGIHDRGVPFLVIEPAKHEYRDLAVEMPELLVFPVGAPPAPGEIPFQFNPFWFPDGFPLHTHIDHLKSTFVASFGLWPPMPFILETALYRVYSRRGWNLGTGRHGQGRHALVFPTLSDLLLEIDPVIEEAGYPEEIVRNLKGALRTRLSNLCIGPKGTCLNTRLNLPDEVLLGTPAVVEIGHLGNDEEKALVMGLLVTRLYESRQASARGDSERLRHLLVIEEAHRLLRKRPERSLEEGNMQGKAVETFVNMLAEIRAYGQGILVAEQLPGKLAPEVVKNACFKFVHRLGPKDERDFVGDMMALTDEQKSALSNFTRGEVAIHGEDVDGSVRVRIDRAPGTKPSTDDPVSRANRRLSPDLAKRLRQAVERGRWSDVLGLAEVRRRAHGVLLAGISGIDTVSCEHALREQCSLGLRNILDPAEDGTVAFVAEAAFCDALSDLALFAHWTEERLDRMLEVRTQGPERLWPLLRRELERSRGGSPVCSSCPVPCRYGFAAHRIATDARCRADCEELLLDERAPFLDRATEWTRTWVEVVFGIRCAALPIDLEACILGELVSVLGIRNEHIGDRLRGEGNHE